MWKFCLYIEFMFVKLCSFLLFVFFNLIFCFFLYYIFFVYCWKCDILIYFLFVYFLLSMFYVFCLVYCCNGKLFVVWFCFDFCVLDDLSDIEFLCISRVKLYYSKFILVFFVFLVSWLRKLECLRYVLKNWGFLFFV